MCAHAVRVAIRKLPGVESVDVSLERALTDIRLTPNNRVTLAQLRQIIKNSGFNASDATVTVVGSLIERGGKPALDLSGLGTVWLLAPDDKQRAPYEEAMKRLASEQRQLAVEIVGVVPVPTNPAEPERIAVQKLTAEPK